MKSTYKMIDQQILKSVWLFVICFLSTYYYSQPFSGKPNGKNEDWGVLFETGQCKIQYKYAVCEKRMDGIVKEEVYLKIFNPSTDVVKVSWDLELQYGTNCYNCHGENEELSYDFLLNPGETMEGACGDHNEFRLKIFSKFLTGESKTELSDFQLKNIRINKIK